MIINRQCTLLSDSLAKAIERVCKQKDKTSMVKHVRVEGMTLNIRLPINSPVTCIAESA